MPDISVVIVNWNGRELLRPCLASLRACSLDLEILVADNASEDGSVDMVRREFPDVIVSVNEQNERFARPNNALMRMATGRFILLLNNDTVVHPGALEHLYEVLLRDPSIGVAAPCLLGTDGKPQESCHGMVTLWTHLFDVTGLDRLFPHSRLFAAGPATFIDYSKPQDVDHAMAAAVLVRREVFEGIGGFDERLSIYYNDLDWSYRIRKAGWRIRFEPGSCITHIGGATTVRMRFDKETISEQYENIMHFFRKHYGPAGLLLYRMLLFVGFVPRVVLWGGLSLIRDHGDVRWRYQYALWSLRVAILGTSGMS